MQSTYCGQLHVHCESVGRRVHIINLDPAAERFDYPVTADIRDLICLEARGGAAMQGGLSNPLSPR